MFAAPVVAFLVAGMFMNGDISGVTAAAYGHMIRADIVSYIAAWILAVIARAKYRSKFGLVLIIIYGSMLAAAVIGAILLFCIFVGLF